MSKFTPSFKISQSPNFHKLGLCFSAKRTPKKAKNSKIDQPLERTTAVFSMVLGFILAKTLCPQRHSKVCFELLETFWVTPKRTCLSVICSSVVGQLRWKEHIKKHKKFLIFLINKLDFISLRKIRNNDRTIEYII